MIHAVDSVTSGEPRASTRLGSDWKTLLTNHAANAAAQLPCPVPLTVRGTQTQTNWADQLSANRYAAGAVVALLAAYVVAGREPPRTSIPPGATLITGLEALAPPRPKSAAPLGGKWPLDVLLVPGYERPPTCEFPC